MFAPTKPIRKLAGVILPGILVILVTGWGALAIIYADSSGGFPGSLGAAAFVLSGAAALAGLWIPGRRRPLLTAFSLFFLVILIGWTRIQPSNDRNWQPDVAILPYADISGERVTVHNIRNFDYRSETDFTPHYYDKTYDVSKLQSVDLIASYWMGPAIAHTFLSFGFEGGDYLAVSIETRKEIGEAYSTIKGFFRNYELYYVVADERDVVRVRTDYRKDPPEDVYLYRIIGPIENARALFMEYMRRINALKEKPEFYNTLTTNCTTTIWTNTRVNPGRLPFSWKLLLSGHVPEYLYEEGRLDTTVPFPELKRLSLINARAQAADGAEDFSQRIRNVAPAGGP